MPTSRPSAGLVADANALLAAVLGKAALRVFNDFALRICATRFNCDEVQEYLPVLTRKFKLDLEVVAIQWQILPLEVHPEESYSGKLPEARARLADRDPDDAHPLALAMTLSLPIWSNDKDLRDLDVDCLTTAELLARLERA